MSEETFRVIGEISKQLLSTGYTPIGVSAALAGVGNVLGVDRVYIFENVKDVQGELCCSQRYEWSAHNVDPQIDNPELQFVPYRDACPTWVAPLSDDQPVYGLVKNMDPAARELLESQDIISILVCPITIRNQWWGFVGFDDCHREREWVHEERMVLGLLARSLAGALRHGQMKQTLDAARAQLKEVASYCSRSPVSRRTSV